MSGMGCWRMSRRRVARRLVLVSPVASLPFVVRADIFWQVIPRRCVVDHGRSASIRLKRSRSSGCSDDVFVDRRACIAWVE